MDDARMRIGVLLVAEHAGLEDGKPTDRKQDTQPGRMARRLSRRETEQKPRLSAAHYYSLVIPRGRPMTWWDAESSDRVLLQEARLIAYRRSFAPDHLGTCENS